MAKLKHTIGDPIVAMLSISCACSQDSSFEKDEEELARRGWEGSGVGMRSDARQEPVSRPRGRSG